MLDTCFVVALLHVKVLVCVARLSLLGVCYTFSSGNDSVLLVTVMLHMETLVDCIMQVETSSPLQVAAPISAAARFLSAFGITHSWMVSYRFC